MPIKRERSSLQCLLSHLQESPALGALPVEVLQQIGSHLTTRERACSFPLICKAIHAASDPKAVGNLWSSLTLSASLLGSGNDWPYDKRLQWVSSRMQQAETLELAFDECRLSDQALQDLEEALRSALRLRRLTLLDVLPSMLSMVAGLSGLEELSLVNISGTDADLGPSLQALSGLTKLKTLSISMVNGKYVGAWPDWSRLSRLESMSLRGSRGYMFPWAALPGWFGDLPKLHSLDISYAGYKEVPEAISGLTQLTDLKLENQCFETPSTQSSASSHANRLLPLRKLKTLSIGSWVGALPAAVATLSDLEDLHIRGELPIDEDDDQVFQVEEQDLSEQQAVLPAQCGHLQALHTLRLDCFSEMKTFPLQIIQLTSLRTLDLSNTCLGSLPLGITALTALQELQLGACSFKSIPAQLLRQMGALRDLNLSRNADLELQQLSLDDLTWLATGLRSVRVDKLQNRAWSKASLPALAFLEEVAALYQQRATAGIQDAPDNATATITTVGTPPDIQAIWERERWLRKGQKRVVMRLNNVKTVPVMLDDYLTVELRTLASKCIVHC